MNGGGIIKAETQRDKMFFALGMMLGRLFGESSPIEQAEQFMNTIKWMGLDEEHYEQTMSTVEALLAKADELNVSIKNKARGRGGREI